MSDTFGADPIDYHVPVRIEISRKAFSRPYGTRLGFYALNPALKGWAILISSLPGRTTAKEDFLKRCPFRFVPAGTRRSNPFILGAKAPLASRRDALKIAQHFSAGW